MNDEQFVEVMAEVLYSYMSTGQFVDADQELQRGYRSRARLYLIALRAAGYAVVPVEPWRPIYAAALNLRKAQKAYMDDRGNESLGRAVGEAAAELDAVLAVSDPQQGEGKTDE